MFAPPSSLGGVDRLVDMPRFVVWREQLRNGKPTKVPYDPVTRREAKADDPRTWAPYATVVRSASSIIGNSRGGIGIELGDLGMGRGLAGIDLDTCRRSDGTLEQWASQVVTLFSTYTEVSPSQTGVKLYCYYDTKDLPALRSAMRTSEWGKQWKRGGGEHPPALELYLGRRYFAVTGDGLPDVEGEITIAPLPLLLRLITEIGPTFAKGAVPGSKPTKSRSEAAFRIGIQAKRAGATYDEMVEQIRQDPETKKWFKEKGEAADGRELKRIWDRAPCDDVGAVIDEFNEQYMVVSEAGKTVVFTIVQDATLDRRRYDRMSFLDLERLYLNRMVKVGVNGAGHPILRNAAKLWLSHPNRRQFIRGVVFKPSGSTPDGVLNLWEGFAFRPVPGDWSLLRQHILAVLCVGDASCFDYLIGWMACLVQRPGEQGEVAVVLRGGEGAGKGTLAKVLLRICGQHGMAISNAKHLVGNFNGHLRDAIFLFADEAFYAGDKQHIGTLKSLITEPYLTIEGKYQNALQTPNRLHLMLASNEEWVVPASLDSRRFFVLDVSGTRANDHPYFAAIWDQMEAGGFEAMLHELLAYDLSKFNVRAVPVTPGLQRQRLLSLPIIDAWWMDCLERGYVFRSKLGLEEYFAEWHDEVSTELLYASYQSFATSRRERFPVSREALGRFMRRMEAKAQRLTNAVVGEHTTEETDAFGNRKTVRRLFRQERPSGYALGDLTTARAAFCNVTGLPPNWDD